ncbi:unnamed protein product [Rotaria sp. Silwood1]|nr:unnamed protein product [Rotaria sp. Silwood1]CAF1584684.1 unnamed protein product [Rotaria sp. Silwood1]
MIDLVPNEILQRIFDTKQIEGGLINLFIQHTKGHQYSDEHLDKCKDDMPVQKKCSLLASSINISTTSRHLAFDTREGIYLFCDELFFGWLK